MTNQRHFPPLPIDEIDGVIFWVLNAQVDQDEHDLVADDVRSHVEKIYRQFRIELEVRFPRQRVRTACLEAHKPKNGFRRCTVVPR